MLRSKILIGFMLFLIGVIFLVPPGEALAKKKAKTVVEELPPLKGPKKTIAVMDFENKAGAAAEWNIGTGMAEMLTTALVNSERFVVVERQAITDVITEQDFAASGRTAESSAAAFGKILNTQIMVRGAVTEFAHRESGGGAAFNIKGFDVGLSGANAHVAVNIRLYDTTTGEVIDSVRCEGKAASTGVDFAYSRCDWGIGTSGFQNTPLGKATQQAINKAVKFIIEKMDKVTWTGKVVTVKGDVIYVNAGSSSNVFSGDSFTVYRPGEALIDPDTGVSLGSEEKRIGTVRVTEVQEKFSKAQAASGGGFQKGDIVKYE